MRSGEEAMVDADKTMFGFQAGDIITSDISGLEWTNQSVVVEGIGSGSACNDKIVGRVVSRGDNYCMFHTGGADGLTLLERPGLRFKVGDYVIDRESHKAGQIIVINPTVPFDTLGNEGIRYLVEFIQEVDWSHKAPSYCDKPWFPTRYRGISKNRLWCREGDLCPAIVGQAGNPDNAASANTDPAAPKLVKNAPDQEKPSFSVFRVGDTISRDESYELPCPWKGSSVIVTQCSASKLSAIGTTSPLEYYTVDPKGLFLLAREGLKFKVGDRICYTNRQMGAFQIIGDVIAIRPAADRADDPYIIEFDGWGVNLKNFLQQPYFPQKLRNAAPDRNNKWCCAEKDMQLVESGKLPTGGADAATTEEVIEMSEMPSWMKELLVKREASIGHLFIIHGNIADWQKNMRGQYLMLLQYLPETFRQRLAVYYSLSTGLQFFSDEAEAEFRNLYQAVFKGQEPPKKPALSPAMQKAAADFQQTSGNMPLSQLMGETPQAVLGKLEQMMKCAEKIGAAKTGAPAPKLAIIIDFAHNIAPGSVSGNAAAAATDRINIEILERWANSRWMRDQGHLIVLLTPQLTDLAPGLRSSGSQAVPIRIAKPAEEDRAAYWKYLLEQNGAEIRDGLDHVRLGRLTGGLSLNQISNIYALAKTNREPITLELIKAKKQEILSAEFGDRVQVKVPLWGFDYFGGKDNVKQYLLEVRDNVLAGLGRRAPMGLLAVGPPGTGKTFLFECWAYECGFNFVVINNPRSMWVGQSEELMEKILAALDDLSPVIVIEDEADQSEAPRDVPNGDSGVSNRLRQMKFTFCSDPKRRGRVIWVRITNRDDLLDEAYKRKGRSDDSLPFVLPDEEELAEIFRVMFERYEILTDIADFAPFAKLAAERIYCTGADVEWMVLEADKFAGRAGAEKVTAEQLLQAVNDWELDLNPRVIDQQIMLALKGSSKRLRPDNWQEILAGAQERLGLNVRPSTSANLPDLSGDSHRVTA